VRRRERARGDCYPRSHSDRGMPMKAAKKSRVKRSSKATTSGSDLAKTALCGTLPEVKKLIQAGVKLDASDRDGFTPLMLAITGGNLKIATYFIEQGADVNRRNRRGQTALMLAAQDGRKEIVEHLIQAGADVLAVDKEKMSAVSWAACRGDFPEVISTLVTFKADPNVRDVRGVTPLMAASLLGYSNSVAVLLTVGADEEINLRGRTAYQMASEKGHSEVCRTIKAVLKSRPPREFWASTTD
jgi:ankyrin repeat protein